MLLPEWDDENGGYATSGSQPTKARPPLVVRLLSWYATARMFTEFITRALQRGPCGVAELMSGRSLIRYIAVPAMLILVGFLWQTCLGDSNSFVVYFGRPMDVFRYARSDWKQLLLSSLQCALTAIASLVLAGVLAFTLLWFGLLRERLLDRVERVAVSSQAIPFLVIVALTLLAEGPLFRWLKVQPPIPLYCIAPVTLSLLFPPLAYGAAAIARIPIQLKSLMRLWRAPKRYRIWHVYLPAAAPDVLTGLRASATWAVGATLIAEGLLNGVEGDTSTLGHFLLRPFSSGPAGRITAVVLLSTALGFAVYYLFVVVQSWIERRLLGHAVKHEHAYPPIT